MEYTVTSILGQGMLVHFSEDLVRPETASSRSPRQAHEKENDADLTAQQPLPSSPMCPAIRIQPILLPPPTLSPLLIAKVLLRWYDKAAVSLHHRLTRLRSYIPCDRKDALSMSRLSAPHQRLKYSPCQQALFYKRSTRCLWIRNKGILISSERLTTPIS